MKFLVDPVGDVIRGSYESPLDFSISGRYVVDVPDGAGVKAVTPAVGDLIAAKVAALKARNPTLVNHFNDEFLTSAQTDTTQSSRISSGPSKRTAILPGGNLVTTQLSIPAPFTQVLIHFYGFRLYSHPGPVTATPAPPRLLYNHDGTNFVNFTPASFLTEIRNAANNATLLTMSQDVVNTYSQATPFNFRLRFTNNASVPLFLSDWTFLYG